MPDARSPDLDVFAALARAFSALGVRWYVFGAQAAILYGVARLTEDIDVTVELGPRGSRDLMEALRSEGFDLRVEDADQFVERTRVLPVYHRAADIPVDVVLSGPGIEETFMARARTIRMDDVDVPVASPEDIIVMKVLAGRPKDLDDAAVIVAAVADRLDLAHVRSMIALLERALDQSDLTPLLERVLAGAP